MLSDNALNDPKAAQQRASVNRGFSKQSVGYDKADRVNIILQDLRKQVYSHIEGFIKSPAQILELNAGTGIDAVHLASLGHAVHATELSDGMITKIREKVSLHSLSDRLTCQQLSYEEIDRVDGRDYDLVFSNFGGLNCIQNLSRVTRHLPLVLKAEGYVTWVIMPPVCPWEILWFAKGKVKQAFRRFRKNGVTAHLEGEYFQTYYHSLADIRRALGPSFKLKRCEGLAALSPPPHSQLPVMHPRLYQLLRNADALVKDSFPFNRWADHLIVTFQYLPR